MPIFPPVGGGRGGSRGGGVYFAEPPRIFTGASLTACRTARNTHFASASNADELAQYQRDQYRAILLKPTSGDYVAETYLVGQQGQAYNAANWINRASATITDAMIDARIAAPARANNPSGTFDDARIPASIARDSEITRDFLLNILGLTAQELNDLFVGAVVSGSGASRVITVTQADGSTITLAVPDTGGGGGESADGRVASGAFAADGTTLTLTLSTGGTVSISVPSVLRQAGLSQSQVQALIDAALAEDVVLISSNTAIPATADSDTYVHTGSSNITVTLPRASGQGAVRNGYEQVIANRGAGDLTIDGHGADTINGEATLVITELGRAVRLQKVSNSAWITIADTKDDEGGDVDTALAAIRAGAHISIDRSTEGQITISGAGESAGLPADGSLTPDKMDADTAAKMAAFRAKFDSSHIGSGNTLPALASVNVDDVRVMTADVASGLSFRDVSDQSTVLTSAFAGDVMMVFLIRGAKAWVRVGNILRGSAPVRALIDAVDAKAVANAAAAAAAQLDLDTVITINKPLVAGVTTQQNVDINIEHPIGSYAGSNTIVLELGGRQYIGNTTYNPNLPRQTIQVGLTSTILTNLNDNGNLEAGDFVWAIFRIQTGTDSASATFRRNINIPVVAASAGGLNQAQVDARVRAVAGPVIIVSNIASFDATQNRFEDSSGNAVTVPNGAIVTLPQAVYDAAVADAEFTPNANAIFLTR